jgi:putative transposase
MPRQPRLDAPGLLQHVIARGIQGSRIFLDRQDYENFLARLEKIVLKSQVRCYAWVLLPDHFHFLLRSGNVHLGKLMRPFMTGYAVTFNRRHKRNGHLFHNRYKSIICEDEPYFLELVRYIHLNPLKAGLVESVSELNGYPWSGHGALLGNRENGWQDTEEVLGCFSSQKARARVDYRRFLEDGTGHEEGLDLEGGGWGRSWNPESEDGSAKMRRSDEVYDERILGRTEFVKRVLDATHSTRTVEKVKMPLPDLITRVSEWCKVGMEDLFLGRRTREVSGARAVISYLAVHKMGYRFSEVGETLKVHPATVARSLEKGKEICDGNREMFPMSSMVLEINQSIPVH